MNDVLALSRTRPNLGNTKYRSSKKVYASIYSMLQFKHSDLLLQVTWPIRMLKFRLKVHWGWIFFVEKSLGPCLLAIDKNYFAPFSLKKKFKRKNIFVGKIQGDEFFFTKINRQKNSTKVVLVGSFFHWCGVSDLPFFCSLPTILAFLHACNKPKEQKDHIDDALVYLFYYAQITSPRCLNIQ